jgi:hydrogenase maturation factor
MHDATEGGVVGGLAELSAAAGVGLRIDQRAIPVRPEVRAVCDHVGIDPYAAISEGTLLATVVPERAEGFVAALVAEGIEAAVVGEVRPSEDGCLLVADDGDRPLVHPGLDPFWAAFGAWANEAEAG